MANFTKGLGIVALSMILNLGAAQAQHYGGGWHGGGHYYGGYRGGYYGGGWGWGDSPPVQFSADCSLRPTIMDRRAVTIMNLRKKMRWPTACSVSNPMTLEVELIWATMAIGTLVLRRIKVDLIGFRRDRRARRSFCWCARHGHRLGGGSPLVSWSQRAKRTAERRSVRPA